MTAISDLLADGPTLSFEFFPPKSPAAEARLRDTVDALEKWEPDFVSVTYGAGGTTRDTTRDIVIEMSAERGFPAMPHLTCVGHSRPEVDDLLADYRANGVDNVLALAGDPQPGIDDPGDFRYALDLVREVRDITEMCIGVAAFPEIHPRSESRESDRRHLAEKLQAADFGITQFFFDHRDYLRMVDELTTLGCETPVIPGIIPVTNPISVQRFADVNGTSTPAGLWDRLLATEDADVRLEIAVEAASDLAEQLLAGGAPGVHLYTLNQPAAIVRICEQMGLRPRP
jgi:methylenetetrahydrofolate reductase (NADPH)